MTTKGLLVSGVAAIALLCGAGLAVLTWLDGGAPRSAGVDPGAAPPAAQPPPSTPSPPPPPAPVSAEPAPASAPRPELPASLAERQQALEPLRQEVFLGLATLDPRVERCRLRDADLLLTLETVDGGVRVADVQVAPAGAATAEATGVAPPPLDEDAVQCVRRSLRDEILRAPSAAPGRRWELHYRPGSRP